MTWGSCFLSVAQIAFIIETASHAFSADGSVRGVTIKVAKLASMCKHVQLRLIIHMVVATWHASRAITLYKWAH